MCHFPALSLWSSLGFNTLTIMQQNSSFRKKKNLHSLVLLFCVSCRAKDEDFKRDDDFDEHDDEKEEEKDKKV